MLREIAIDPAARGLADDAAVFAPPPGRELVVTHDMLVEGVHFLPDDPPRDVAWKLVAVNLSDLAAKGATLLGVLLGYTLGDADWNTGFLSGLREVLGIYNVSLLGGDTVSNARGARSFGLTAIGHVAPGTAPSRSGACDGDDLWVCGVIGDAGLGLAMARGEREGRASLLDAYRRPVALVDEGIALAPFAHAMADVSDGLLIDVARMADASGLGCTIALEAIPRSAEACNQIGNGTAARLAAVTAGDDYALILAAPPSAAEAFAALAKAAAACAVRVGRFSAGSGIALTEDGAPVPLPARLGYLHGAAC